MTFSAYDNAREFATQQLHAVNEQRLLSRICVSAPYFALQTLSYGDKRLRASATAGLPMGLEVGPMSSAEISRHAAIAGLCVAALTQHDDDRRFYLAQRAEYSSVLNSAPYGSQVQFEARLEALNKRGARSTIQVSAADKPLARLIIDYTILTDYAFKRLFRSHRRPTCPQTEMDSRLPGTLSVENGRALHELTALPEAACAGHFVDYPALPVALLLGQLGTTAAHLMASEKWRGLRAVVNATDLCWAGERVRFEAVRASPPRAQAAAETATLFNCRVVAEERVVCTAEFALEAH